MCVCVGRRGGGGNEAIIKLKGAGATHALARSYLPTVACTLDCLTKSNPDGIFLILNSN